MDLAFGINITNGDSVAENRDVRESVLGKYPKTL